MVVCRQCGAENPDGKRFCGDCGAVLDSTASRQQTPTPSLQDRVRDAVRALHKDQKVVEIETAQAIATRLTDWAKLLAFFIGVPVALLLFLLGVLGFKTYSDFAKQIEAIGSQVTRRLADAQSNATLLKSEADTLNREYQKLRAQLADSTALAGQVKTLSEKVDVIGARLGFTLSSKVTPELKNHLELSLRKFQQYLHTLGYQGTDERIEIDLPDKIENGILAYYDPNKKRMVIDSKIASNVSVLYREYMHHVLYPDGLPKDPGLKLWSYYAIESALAWYLPCSFLDNPQQEVSPWDITKKRSFTELRPDLNSAQRDGTEIWGGAFWEMRQSLGQVTADKLLLKTWFQLKPEEVRADRGVSFVRKLMDADEANQEKIRGIFNGRGLLL